jgi:2-oxo-4-hydroxy-4-carboxy--5-ureidoimidazoline (OHCU) decarboxylase
LLVLFNAAPSHVIPFTLPELVERQPWELLLDTFTSQHEHSRFPARRAYDLQPFSAALFRHCAPVNE